ncbi:transketolase family protein [Roseospirillum parvum]|uniref:Transketolase n=1 Tax=Roseospirillum parvum TaxID=83401 RepID=A0A1G7TUP7_9PROT|nr:transketolase C-terminal domain-containing protein [Roseospirillum parvum]SDG38744.1 transketolase [Roseospirillum parvum]
MRRTALDMVHELARRDSRVVYVGSDPAPGTLAAMQAEMPGRVMIEGIAEQHVVGMAAGLAMEGLVPYVNTIATFLTRRCYEQNVLDLGLHRTPVRLIANGGGLVYAPLGPTHTAIEDIAIMRAIPGMAVLCPSDAEEMRRLMPLTLDWPGPIYIRLGKGGDPVVSQPDDAPAIGRALVRRPPGVATIISTGIMTAHALAAAERLGQQGIDCGVIHLPGVAPMDDAAIEAASRHSRLLVTLDEHIASGGLGSAVLESLNRTRPLSPCPVLRRALPDDFVHLHGSQNELLSHFGLDAPALAEAIARALAELAGD